MPQNIFQPTRFRSREQGVALVITLAILTIVTLLALAFLITARMELKSGSSYNDQILAKSLAKMAVDRALMEAVRQGAATVASGVNNGYAQNYSTRDLTQIDNYTNDALYFSGTIQGDFVTFDPVTNRTVNDPYWIGVTNNQGVLVGRFAYIAKGSVLDINAIGNIAGPSDTYRRGDSLYGSGYIGTSCTTGTINYIHGICPDVSLQKFLAKLGYADPVGSAQRILWYRYGWNPATAPTVGAYFPGNASTDNNCDGVLNNPTEYCENPLVGTANQFIGSLNQVYSGATPILATPIDLAYTNLANYATVGPTGDPNLTNIFKIARVNLNAMGTNAVSDVPILLSMFQTASISFVNPTNVAVNLIDFHTTNRYPTVYVTINGTTTNAYIGVKPTPYLNQIVLSNQLIQTTCLLSNSTSQLFCTGRFLNVSSVIFGEVWQPYIGTFPDSCQIVVTNTIKSSGATSGNLNRTIGSSNTFASIANGYTFNSATVLASTNITYSSNNLPIFVPGTVSITQTISSVQFLGNSVNLINQISQVVTNLTGTPVNLASFINGWSTNVWPAVPTQIPTNGMSKVANSVTNYWVTNLEADDPRMNLLYLQLNLNANCNLGAQNIMMSSDVLNPLTTYPTNTTAREGLSSFYVKTNSYVSIGEIGFVYRGEPWATIRLQPGGEGRLLDYVRVNDFVDVAGRVNINSDPNGPMGVWQSPALFALLDGVTNLVSASTQNYGTLTDAKIGSIIQGIYNYRTMRPLQSMQYIGEMCEVTNLMTDASGATISATNDAAREAIICQIANLLTTRSGGCTEVVGWGQVVKGATTNSVGMATGGVMMIIDATFQNVGGRIKLISYRYVTQ